jgi:15-cis-phytoene synthase
MNQQLHRHDLQQCAQLMQGGSKSFFAASLLLPKQIRSPATALYAFCRLADDAVDLSKDQLAALHMLRARLCAMYDTQPHNYAADRALAKVVHHYHLPQAILEALLEGFVWDAQGRQYHTLEDLYAYAARVAGTVGAMMAIIMNVHDPIALARACEMGVAMQLTNIARDAGEDARAGRLYLPRTWMMQEGIDPDEWLANPQITAPLRRVIARLIHAADALYARADQGIGHLPRACRPAIRAARLVYAHIGRKIEALEHDSVSQRAVVSTRRKLLLLVRASVAAITLPKHAQQLPALPQIQFLVDAAQRTHAVTQTPRNFYERTLWVIELFERLAIDNQASRRIS